MSFFTVPGADLASPAGRRRSCLFVGFSGFFTAVVLAGCGNVVESGSPLRVPTALAIVAATDSQRGQVGQSLTSSLAVRVFDQSGNPLPGAGVSWTVLSGGGSVNPGMSISDASGEATTGWTLGRGAGVQTVSATLVNGVVDTLTAVAEPGLVATFALLDGDNQSLPAGQLSAPLRVRATDRFNNVVPSVMVSWSTTGGTLSQTQSVTDSSGAASAIVRLAVGSQVVTARLVTGASLTFTLTGLER